MKLKMLESVSLERAMLDLLDKVTKVVMPRLIKRQKWHHSSKGTAQLREVIDQTDSVVWAVMGATHPEVVVLQQKAESLFRQDKVFGSASAIAGYYGSFSPFLQDLVAVSGYIKGRRLKFDLNRAGQFIKERRDFFSRSSFEYSCSARISDLTLNRQLRVGKVTLRNLTVGELNREERFIEFLSVKPSRVNFRDRAGAFFTFSIVVDKSAPSAFFKAGESALAKATKLLEDTLDAISVSTGKALSYHSLKMSGGFDSGVRRLVPDEAPFTFLTLGRQHIPRAERVLGWLQEPGDDTTLAACLHRIVLAHKRFRVSDRLVDLVIAWESLTLTSAGNAIRDELSYRFAVNGTLLLLRVTRGVKGLELFAKLKGAYSARSTIVHGGSESELDKEVKKAGFVNTNEMAEFLDERLRLVLDWLGSVQSSVRPYKARDGWELLLWNQ